MKTTALSLIIDNEHSLPILYGDLDKHLRLIENTHGVVLSARGRTILIEGDEKAVAGAERLIRQLADMLAKGVISRKEDVLSAILRREVSRIILVRPAVEAGEKLGFLPGDLFEKVNPYLRPLYDALFDMIETKKANKLMERGDIEIAPLAFMRGRTLNDSFIEQYEASDERG